jgi:hypothetical protein
MQNNGAVEQMKGDLHDPLIYESPGNLLEMQILWFFKKSFTET